MTAMELRLLVLVIAGFFAGVAFLRPGRGIFSNRSDGSDWCGPPPRDPSVAGPSLWARLWRRLRPG